MADPRFFNRQGPFTLAQIAEAYAALATFDAASTASSASCAIRR